MARLLLECVLATLAALTLAWSYGLSSAWVLVPLSIVWLARRPIDDLGVSLRLTPPPLATHLLLGGALLAAYAAAHVGVAVLGAGERFVPALPPGLGALALGQLVAVALPEELFFRGYLQSTLDRAFGRRGRLWGAAVGPGLWLQAAIFGLCHLVGGDWTRLRVALFGLLAGWLRAKSGSIAAPVVYHLVANLAVAAIEASLRRG